MKNILLRLDDKLFYKMSEDKARRERIMKESLTWEEYIKLIFGFKDDSV